MAELDRRTRTINLLIRFAAFVIYLVLGLLVFKAIENSGRHDEPGSTGKIWQGNHTRKGPTMEELKLNITQRFNISGSEFNKLAEAILEAEEQEYGKEGNSEDWMKHLEEEFEHVGDEKEHPEDEKEHNEDEKGRHEDEKGIHEGDKESYEHHDEESDHLYEGWWREEKMTYHESFALAFHIITTIGE